MQPISAGQRICENGLIFSTNTYLAYAIAESYYNHMHYAWFTAKFDYGIAQPSSSNPKSICEHLLLAIASQDDHCEMLERIKLGILRGASEKRKHGTINEKQELDIRAIVDKAPLSLYMPIVFVASWELAGQYCEEVPITDRASQSSVELLSRALPRNAFDIIDTQKLLGSIDCFARRDLL